VVLDVVAADVVVDGVVVCPGAKGADSKLLETDVSVFVEIERLSVQVCFVCEIELVNNGDHDVDINE